MDQTRQAPSALDTSALAVTRRRLHGIGECLMAGPQRRAGGRFTLRVTPGGFATTGGPALRLDGMDVVVNESRRVAVAGTFSELAEALGVEFGPPPDAYPEGSEAQPTDDVALDARSARLIQDWYLMADAALRVMAPRETPILWPEHFDVAILLDDTSYGASPGDAFHATPYAYVSSVAVSGLRGGGDANSAAVSGLRSDGDTGSSDGADGDTSRSDFWNAPFGAFRDVEQMSSIDDLVGFWRAAQSLLRSPA